MRGIGLIMLLASLLVAPAFAQDEGEKKPDVQVSYIDIKPSFIINYGGTGKLRYVRCDIALRLEGGPSGQSQVRHHMPYIRHAIVMRLSRTQDEELSSMEGRELLRQDVLQEVRDMLIREDGEQFVDDLLFNSFVVQR
ncbi:MAG: flagellar FliL protein [Oceanicoccus sp.]|jgi:flagellar FliL protein